MRAEFLDHAAPFELIAAAQEAVDAWGHAYNHQRPHQALDIAVPASLFRPNGPTRLDAANRESQEQDATPPSLVIDVIEPSREPPTVSAAVEFEVRVPPVARSRSAPGASRCRCIRAWPDAR